MAKTRTIYPILVLVFAWLAFLQSLPGKESPRTLFVNNSSYHDNLLADIKGASASIDAAIYLVATQPQRRRDLVRDFLNALIAARQRGCTVNVIFDQAIKPGSAETSPNSAAFEQLKQGGVTVRYDTPDCVTHAKCVVIDGKIIYLGSANWTYSAFRKNNEVNLRLEDSELATELKAYISSLLSVDKP